MKKKLTEAKRLLIDELKRQLPVAVLYDIGGGCFGGVYVYPDGHVISLGEEGTYTKKETLADLDLTALSQLVEDGVHQGDEDWEYIQGGLEQSEKDLGVE